MKIIPYIEVDGARTFTDSVIMRLFDRVADEGLQRVVFYEGTIKSRKYFLSIMKGLHNHLYILLEKKEIVGFVWLNRFEGKTAHLHFCMFKNTWGTGQNVEIGKYVLSKLINMGAPGFFFDLFIGWLPEWNTHAIGFIKRCGAQTAGVIPNAIYNAKTEQSEPAVFVYLTREDLE